ncbi:MAG TPA: hypothetical protein VK918_07640 [Pyrinomonadaceae bacterium]|nr:hypothetical protein [Pyrinomonadaceae bacterium]
MKSVTKHYRIMAALIVFAAGALGQGEADISLTTAEFQGRVNTYMEKRAAIKAGLPSLSESATPEEINRHKTSLLEAIQKDRVNAEEGDILTPAAVNAIRHIILKEYQEDELTELRKTIFEAENSKVPAKVNTVYPPSEERLEMPPRLLEVLPKLPDELRYRFVGDALLIVDKENELILDLARKVLP